MYPILFKIGNLNFYSHGVLMVIGIVFAALMVHLISKREDMDGDFLFNNVIYTVLFGIVGARITYFMLYPEQFDSLSQLIFLWEGGLVSYGGFILGGLTFLILLKVQKQPVLRWFDMLAVGFPVGIFFARIGDIVSGDYYNASVFTSLSSFRNGLPTPLHEALLCLLVFVIALIVVLKKKKISPGIVFFLTLLLYSGGRFIIDFWRNEEAIFWSLSFGQLFGLAIFLITLIMIILLSLKSRKKGENYGIVS